MKRNRKKKPLILTKIKVARLEPLGVINGGANNQETFFNTECIETYVDCSTLTDPIGIYSRPCING